jgi:hypothetical protein
MQFLLSIALTVSNHVKIIYHIQSFVNRCFTKMIVQNRVVRCSDYPLPAESQRKGANIRINAREVFNGQVALRVPDLLGPTRKRTTKLLRLNNSAAFAPKKIDPRRENLRQAFPHSKP